MSYFSEPGSWASVDVSCLGVRLTQRNTIKKQSFRCKFELWIQSCLKSLLLAGFLSLGTIHSLELDNSLLCRTVPDMLTTPLTFTHQMLIVHLRHTLRTKMSLGFAKWFKFFVSIKSHPDCPIFMRSIKYPFCFDPFEFRFCSSLIGACCSQREMRCFLELHMERREVCIFPELLRYTSGRKCSVSSHIKHSHKKCCGSEKNHPTCLGRLVGRVEIWTGHCRIVGSVRQWGTLCNRVVKSWADTARSSDPRESVRYLIVLRRQNGPESQCQDKKLWADT